MSELDKWAEDLTKEAYNQWNNKYSFWKPGFKTFYSPITKNPTLMILSLNPGGTESHFEQESKTEFDNNNFSLPKRNEYLTTDYRMAKKMRLLFRDHLNLLDPMISTEPLSTGKIIYGNFEKYYKFKKLLKSPIIPENALSYLSRRCLTEYQNSITFYNQQNYFESLKSLSFSVSYSLFCKWYTNNNKIPTMNYLISISDNFFIKELFSILHNHKSTKLISNDIIIDFITKWEKTLVLGI